MSRRSFVITVPEAAVLTGVSSQGLYNAIARRRLSVRRRNGRTLLSMDGITKYMSTRPRTSATRTSLERVLQRAHEVA